MIKGLYTTIAMTLLSMATFAQEPTGSWYGALEIQGNQLPLVFHVTKKGSDYTTTMDSPKQSATGMPTNKTTFINKILTIEASAIGMKYSGTYLPDSNKINGTFEQGPLRTALVLRNKPEQEVAKKRPQDPKDFPYKQEEVVFPNAKAGNSLAGTLTLPANGKATKIVILISGSGPQDRNEEAASYNHRPFLVLSDYLTREGIAVLRYDDRGIGKSTGDFAKATTADFADDAEAAVKYILSRPDLKNMPIGLIGHSEGGIIAPMVASCNANVKFIVLMAGPGVPISELLAKQNGNMLKLAGAPADEIAKKTNLNLKIYAAIKEGNDLPLAQAEPIIELALRKEFDSLPVGELDIATKNMIIKQVIASYSSPWIRYFVPFDPTVYLTKVKCPVLALNGTLDFQVSSTENLNGIKAALEKAGNKKFEIVPMEGLNHLFQKATTGAESEYKSIEETINPAVLEKVSAWVKGV